ncbi:MAG: D-alanine--D-alanine ligase [candidate division Zixibacteria bacterium]|nr:D-alanine--D-alanine ligase [candidate division Zixibacteria bacterium]MBU1471955.1 D-alanine--D-alanine ligase [candidate division Zixibacteria bacterium]MBU2626156.1 D-alanine--D-alanine ligase [candidate division Zixibacteria bacterium]
MKVLVLLGGLSPERDVSLDSGSAVCEALKNSGNDVIAIDTGAGVLIPEAQSKSIKAAVRHEPPAVAALTALDKKSTLRTIRETDLSDIDVVFIALHGGSGENGTIQALLDLAGIPYTGSGVLASALAMDKDVSKKIFEREKIPTPDWTIVESIDGGDYVNFLKPIADQFGFPVIVKPADGGSTVGLTLVKSADKLSSALQLAGELSRKIMVEKYIAGRELTVGILRGKPLPVAEIIASHELYDYECKYLPGMSQYVVPAEIDSALAGRLQELGVKAFQALECAGYARIDFRVDATGEPYCLEVNTLPGMTSTSLVPKAAKADGISFDKLIEIICNDAIARFRK